MGAIAFKFKLPGKKDLPEEPEKKDSEDTTDDSESSEYTKAELGKMLLSAIKANDGEAVFEAYRKLSSCEPSDE